MVDNKYFNLSRRGRPRQCKHTHKDKSFIKPTKFEMDAKYVSRNHHKRFTFDIKDKVERIEQRLCEK
jgi:hypothetical protein